MGNKHSSYTKKRLGTTFNKPDSTEIVDLETTEECDIDNQTQRHGQGPHVAMDLPQKLVTVMEKLDDLEGQIITMTESQINLYYPTFKDELHNNWQKVYEIVAVNDVVKRKKVEVIERIKAALEKLNDKYFKRRTRKATSHT